MSFGWSQRPEPITTSNAAPATTAPITNKPSLK
jgi:hypothetical protein